MKRKRMQENLLCLTEQHTMNRYGAGGIVPHAADLDIRCE
jgi:hypothetical protein